ncbi:MAG: deoxynucleoside kinase [Chitinophagales bacterium]
MAFFIFVAVSNQKSERVKDGNKKIKHIAIAGNIGAGKTTLAGLLGKHFGWHVYYEDVEKNPYLEDFYKNMPRWSFNLQVYFLNSRFNQIIEIQEGDRVVIQDRTIYEDAHIFAPNLYEMNLMSKRDFENYVNLFKTIDSLFNPPDLLIYLKASTPTLVKQIQRRGRDYEDKIRLDYLEKLNNYYDNWIENYKEGKLLVVNIDDVNFADNQEDLSEVIDKITVELDGLL